MRRVIVVVLGLTVVLVGLDFAARAAAQEVVARKVQVAEDLSHRPNVEIAGFPFLLQAARGTYEQMDVQLQEVPAGDQLRLDDVDARLSGVHVPLSVLLGSGPRSVPVDTAQVTGRVSYSTLDAHVTAAIPGGAAKLRFADGGGNQLRVTVTYLGLGDPLTLTGTAKLAISGGRLTMKVAEDTLAQVPAPLRPSVAPLLNQSVPLQRLPFGLVPTSVAVTDQGVTVTALAHDTTLG